MMTVTVWVPLDMHERVVYKAYDIVHHDDEQEAIDNVIKGMLCWRGVYIFICYHEMERRGEVWSQI